MARRFPVLDSDSGDGDAQQGYSPEICHQAPDLLLEEILVLLEHFNASHLKVNHFETPSMTPPVHPLKTSQ